jgi:hypothetical protein
MFVNKKEQIEEDFAKVFEIKYFDPFNNTHFIGVCCTNSLFHEYYNINEQIITNIWQVRYLKHSVHSTSAAANHAFLAFHWFTLHSSLFELKVLLTFERERVTTDTGEQPAGRTKQWDNENSWKPFIISLVSTIVVTVFHLLPGNYVKYLQVQDCFQL